MPLLSHKFRYHVIDPKTEILIIGTFNPNIPEGPDFFYGRPRNFLWQLLPQVYGLPSLKYAGLQAKSDFMDEYCVDFVDLITILNVDEGQEDNVADTYIDDKVVEWCGINELINDLPKLSAVFFTRKTFAGVPNIKAAIRAIRQHSLERGFYFACLPTPARFANVAKQAFWISKILNREACDAL